ncbi:MAG TPA: M1 family metallopeptidase [Acidobacteriota bacterium]|nr:M1 family metallopeptidase [Acidobacteriota bacterium]
MRQRAGFLTATILLSVSALSCLLFLAIPGCASGQPPKLRLSEVQDAAPVSYRVDLTLDPSKETFTGLIDIKILVVKPVQTLWLNANKINVLDASATAGRASVTAKPIPGGDDFLGLEFKSAIAPGPAEIHIKYTGLVRQADTSGIFHLEDKGNHYIYTQFESTDARDAFPCFDEPSFKTPWQLTLHVPMQDSAVSNSPAVSETAAGGVRKYVFKETKPLPSYLIAFAVGPFEFVDAGVAGQNRIPVRIVTPKGRSGEAKYAAEVTATILTRLEDYFGIPYPYDKSDQVSVPTAGFGAMENAGMVTYSQTMILAEPDSDTIGRQRDYASVSAHELSHQWFGDLVTMQWWNDTWLNEAFATWMEQKLIAGWKPEWKSRIDDVGSKLEAEESDSLATARMIRQPIESKGDIGSAFDTITYQKGAAVIGMFESWMGPELFREGVHRYLGHYAYKNAAAADFLDALGAVVKGDVKGPFSAFLNQAGVPVVSILLDCSRKEPALHLEQERFLPIGSKKAASGIWSIPVCVRYGVGTRSGRECILMTKPATDWPLKAGQECPAWVEANDQAKGYYRVDYRGDLYGALTAGDVSGRLEDSERVDFIGNAHAMAKAGRLSAAQSLALVEKFQDDPEPRVVDRALDVALSPRAHSAVPPDLASNYRRFLLKNFQSRARELGWVPRQGESEDVRLLRPRLVRTIATFGDDQELATQAREFTERWFQNHTAVNPEVLGAVLATAAYFGDQALFKRFFEEFKKTQDRQDKERLLQAMTFFRDKAVIESAMESSMRAMQSQEISLLEAVTLISGLGQDDPETQALPFAFLRAHYDEIMKGNPNIFGTDLLDLLPGLGNSFCDAKSRDELQSYFEPRLKGHSAGQRTLAQVIEGIDQCIAITTAQKESIAGFLKKY